MADATRLHEQRAVIRARRAIAVATGLWFVTCTLLGMRHEAQVAHVVDPTTGEVRHADQVLRHCTSKTADMHSAERGGDDGVCALSTVLHQAAEPVLPRIAVASAITTDVVDLPVVRPTSLGAALYRFAPKTSPPTFA